MESLFHSLNSVMMIIIALVTLFIYFFTISKKSSHKRLPPEAAGGWPVIGHLHLLAGSQPVHITLGNLADQIGPIFTIKIGVHRVLVVNSCELARECLTTNDKAFANRPKALAMEILGYNYLMLGTSPYGEYWRQVRKIISLRILSNQRVQTLKHVREAEVKTSMEVLYQEWIKNKNNSDKVLVEMKRWFWDLTLNVIFKIVIGKRYVEPKKGDDGRESDDEWRHEMKDFLKLTGKFVVSDAFPFLRWLDIGGDEKMLKKTAKNLDNVLEGWLHEHKQKRASGMVKEGEEDFMDELLSILDDTKEFSSQDVNNIIKSTCLALILAASDSTAATLTWTLSLLLNNRHVLKKAQQELDCRVGRERQVNESDMKDLVYIQAIIKESFRLYPAGPLAVPHESMEDCSVGGYHIPAGTRLILNISKIQRDSRVWPNPSEFKPERFLTTHNDVDVKGQNFELIPFSSGRRMCPAVSFSLQVLNLALSTLLHSYEIETPSGQPVDMSEGAGQVNIKLTPIDALLTPRLPSYLY